MIAANIHKINQDIGPEVRLIAVSKTKTIPQLLEAYAAGQRLFGENKVQEMVSKQPEMPADVSWHMIGHLQSNKVKYLAPFVSLIHSVDSLALLKTIQKEAFKNHRIIPVLLQVYIAREESKFGFDQTELEQVLQEIKINPLPNVKICGLMGMASNTENQEQVREEFRGLKKIFQEIKQQHFKDDRDFCELSMGMSGDYQIAVEEGSTLVRVGSSIFGSR